MLCCAAPRPAELARHKRGPVPRWLDTDSNCTDFLTAPATALSAASEPGATNIKVASVAGLAAGQTIRIGTGANLETAVIATVGTAGATTLPPLPWARPISLSPVLRASWPGHHYWERRKL